MRSQKICSTQSTAVSGARTEEEKERKQWREGSDSIHQTSWTRFLFLNYILSSIIDFI